MSRSITLLLLMAVLATTYAVDVEVLNEGLGNGSLILPNGTRAMRSMLTNLLRQTNLPFVVREIGRIECIGAGHFFGTDFFERLLGPGNDFGGNFICQPTCRGECIPNQDIGIAPVSLYPFGCRCAPDGCNQEGPIIQDVPSGVFKVVCVRDPRCSCQGMNQGHSVGYLCNWLNLKSHRIVAFLDRPPRPDITPLIHRSAGAVVVLSQSFDSGPAVKDLFNCLKLWFKFQVTYICEFERNMNN